jgi:hypothetical protein
VEREGGREGERERGKDNVECLNAKKRVKSLKHTYAGASSKTHTHTHTQTHKHTHTRTH